MAARIRSRKFGAARLFAGASWAKMGGAYGVVTGQTARRVIRVASRPAKDRRGAVQT
jgi:hypothetical protein